MVNYYTKKRQRKRKVQFISLGILLILSVIVSYFYIKVPTASVTEVIKPTSSITLDETASIEITTLFSCGHKKTEVLPTDTGLKNKTQEEIEALKPNWEIKSFTKNYVTVDEKSDKNCGNHFLIKLNDNKILVYKDENSTEILKEIEIDTNLLTEDDKKILMSGITVNSEYELLEILESFY